MIRAEELRIGNLVYHGSEIKTVKSINEYEVITTYGYVANILDIDPIPLNEEWLVKFGFKQDDQLLHYYKLEYFLIGSLLPGYLSISLREDYIEVCRNSMCACQCPCRYVHQLQNIYFSLTGKELIYTP